MRYIQSPPNHRGPRILLAVALSVGVHVAAVGLVGVLSAATPPSIEVEPLTESGIEQGNFELPIWELPNSEIPLPEVSVVEAPPPVVEVTVEEEPPLSTAATPDFFEPTPAPARRATAATPPSAPRTAAPALRANVAPGGNPGAGTPGGIPGAGGASGARWVTPKPPYPATSRTMRQTGSGSVRIQTDASGRVVSAEMVQSITPQLDAATTSFARGYWSGPPNRTVVVPVTFRLQ